MKIKTFSNAPQGSGGGNSVFKALSHPLAAPKARDLLASLKGKKIAMYDPLGTAFDMADLYDLSGLTLAGYYIQNVADIGKSFQGHDAQPVTALKDAKADTVFVVTFDPRMIDHIRHLVPANANIVTLDSMRLPEDMLTNRRNYLDPLNFATNFCFFREEGGHHTRLVTANYWAGYGAKDTWIWFNLFDAKGATIAQWKQKLEQGTQLIAIDSAQVRKDHNLPPFTGSLFLHAVNIAGHDTVKYALDTYGDDETILSCTHDANAWPADLYAGVPAPKSGETVTLWVENCYPTPIPANTIGFNLMGNDNIARFDETIEPYGHRAINVGNLLPKAAWPQQIEVQAHRTFARPRYEVKSAQGRLRIAHANVERVDLKTDPGIPGLTNLMGKGYILPAPILPLDRYKSIALPTPMSTAQENLPLAILFYDANGTEVARHNIGLLQRSDSVAFDAVEILKQHGATLPSNTGHMELIYDFAAKGDKGVGGADGWLHGLFRYEDGTSGHAAETSFGAHIFNTALVYKNEPQSYTGKPPGLSTRLFLRLGHGTPGSASRPDAFCHLVYPASTPWHATSETDLILFDAHGTERAKTRINIPCSGSKLWRASEAFSADDLKAAGENAYILIRDTTCRLFGYHGLMNGDKAFSLDHMFGF